MCKSSSDPCFTMLSFSFSTVVVVVAVVVDRLELVHRAAIGDSSESNRNVQMQMGTVMIWSSLFSAEDKNI